MQTFKSNKEKAAALAAQLWLIHEHSITPGDPNDKEPVFAYVHGPFFRDTIREASALLESLSEIMED